MNTDIEALKSHGYLKSMDDGLKKDFFVKFWNALKVAEKSVEYEWRDEAKCKARRVMSIFCHHINSQISDLDLAKALLKKGERTQADVANRERVLKHDLNSAVYFIAGVLSGEPSDRVVFHEYGETMTFVAVKEGKDLYKLRRHVLRDDIPMEMKKLRRVIKSGGAYYYKDMLEELKSGDYKKYYYVVG